MVIVKPLGFCLVSSASGHRATHYGGHKMNRQSTITRSLQLPASCGHQFYHIQVIQEKRYEMKTNQKRTVTICLDGYACSSQPTS